MIFDQLSPVTQEGLRLWCEAIWRDSMVLDQQGGAMATWAWACVLLRESQDRPEWFPRGKWATIQIIEAMLLVEARAELGEKNRKP